MGKDVTIRSIDPEAIRRIDELIPPGVSREEVLRRSIESRWMGEVEPQLSLFSDAVEPTVVFGDMPFRFIDLFAGIGGFRSALTRLGGECVYTSEWDKYAAMTYEAWYGDRPDQTDIREVDYDAIPDHDVLAAGFPCQPFSLAGVSKKNSLGRLHGFEDEKQGNLFFSILDIIDAKRPPVLFLENVKNLKSHDRGRTWEVIHDELVNRDYEVHHEVVDASGWVPQHRERIFIVAFDRTVFNEEATSFFRFPRPPADSPVFHSILESKPDPKYTLSDPLWQYLKNYRAKHEAKGNGFGYGIAPLNGASRTMSARYYKDGSEILIEQRGRNPRRLTSREASRLLGFDGRYSNLFGHGDEFPQVVSDTQAYKQFGNAVVPKVVEAIGQGILTVMAAAIFETGSGCLLKGRTARGSMIFPKPLDRSQPRWAEIAAHFRTRGVTRVFLKHLAHNDNEKNQIYLGPSLDGLAGVLGARLTEGAASDSTEKPDSSPGRQKVVAHLDWTWIGDGPDAPAPSAKLIHYFQYPEVRFSGFLSSCPDAPDALRRRRLDDYGDRILLFGSNGMKTFGTVVASPPGVPLPDLPDTHPSAISDILLELNLEESGDTESSIREILGTWHPTIRLPRADGPTIPFSGPQAPGYTLEALLGVPTNATPGPDHLGSELKTFRFGGRVTLMTPVADRGEEKRLGTRAFLNAHGNPGRDGQSTRFTGTYRVGQEVNGRTLTMQGCSGHLLETQAVDLIDVQSQTNLAGWTSTHIGNSWLKKHDSAFYVEYERDEPRGLVRFLGFYRCRYTSLERLLKAITDGIVYYDPAHTLKSNKLKVRPQWRINASRRTFSDTLGRLYAESRWVGD